MAGLAETRLSLEHLGDPSARGERLLQRRDPLAEHPQRPDEHHDVRVEGHERAQREVSCDHAAPPEPEHGRDPDEGQHLEKRIEDRVEPSQVERAAQHLVAPVPKASRQRLAGAEALDHADSAHRLLDERRRLAPRLLQPLSAGVVAARVEPCRQGDDRQRDQHDQRQLGVEHEHHDRDRDDGEHVADRVADRVHHPRDVLRVGRGTAQQLAGADAVVVGGIQAQGVREERVPDACVRL